MRPTVLLFDIDGTLLSSGGAGRRAMDGAFSQLHGRQDACAGFRLDGMTDGSIVAQGLASIGVQTSKANVQAVLDRYLLLLEDEVSAATEASYRLHDGMKRALIRAAERPHTALGLGTGNVRPGARIKLARVGVFEAFSFGGFGCDHDLRVELIRMGAERGAEKLGLPVSECRVVIIGDTPKDVLAAKGIGAECIGVGTGRYTPRELMAAGADRAFENLEADGALAAVLGDA